MSEQKSNRDVNFDPTGFNKDFLEKDKINLGSNEVDYGYSIENNYLPHQQPINVIINNVRELFFIVLEMVIDKKNPLPYIFASETRKFSFAVFLILFGTLFLLLATLMKSN